MLAMLLAFAAKPADLEVLLVSLTFGNIDLRKSVASIILYPRCHHARDLTFFIAL